MLKIDKMKKQLVKDTKKEKAKRKSESIRGAFTRPGAIGSFKLEIFAKNFVF